MAAASADKLAHLLGLGLFRDSTLGKVLITR
jgi:hypothetical protein